MLFEIWQKVRKAQQMRAQAATDYVARGNRTRIGPRHGPLGKVA